MRGHMHSRFLGLHKKRYEIIARKTNFIPSDINRNKLVLVIDNKVRDSFSQNARINPNSNTDEAESHRKSLFCTIQTFDKRGVNRFIIEVRMIDSYETRGIAKLKNANTLAIGVFAGFEGY